MRQPERHRWTGPVFGLILLITLVIATGASTFALTGRYSAHDPSLIRVDDCYYAFSTGNPQVNEGTITIWRSCGSIVGPWAPVGTVFEAQPKWIEEQLGVKPEHLWAPHITYHNGRYYLYYTGSTWGSNNSVIGLATNTTLDRDDPDYEWVDEGMVFRSFRNNNYNAIDPFVVWGEDEAWLIFGSHWDGIKMRRLDPKTGHLDPNDPRIYSLASRQGGAIEAPALLYRDGYYYLFVSFDQCCSGPNSTYNIRVGRATSITGPYRDRDGRLMLSGGGTQILGRSQFPSADGTINEVRGAGGQDVYFDGDKWLLVYHWYPATGGHRMAISELSWTEDGWPVVGPML